MDERENEAEVLQTERTERLTVASEKPVLDENWQVVKALLDNSYEAQPGHEDGNSNSKEMVIENNQNVADGLMLDDTNCIPYPAEDNSFTSDNVAQILSPSAADGNESIAIECTEATTEQDTSSFIVVDSPEEATANTAEKKDLSFVIGKHYGEVTSVLASSTEIADTSDLQTSVLEANSSTSEYGNEELTELSVADSSCPQSTTKDAESVSQSLEELCSSVKEPEEADHAEKCHLLHDNKMTSDEAASKTSVDWLYILGHDKLKKRVICPGHEHDRPQRGQRVTVKCCGRLEDGTEIDRYDDLKLVLGDADFILAFDLCIALMDRGEKCELVSDAQYAYGELGRDPDVPRNANITYEIELLSYEDEPSLSLMPVSERLRLSNEKRERGNYLYARNDFVRAITVYEKAVKTADADNASSSESASDLQLLLELQMKCYNNLAAAQLKVEAWDEAIKSCNSVLRVQPNNVKALFRKAKCLIHKGDCDTAIALLRRALKLDPDNKTVQNELTRIEKRCKEMESHQRQLYRKMLGTAGAEAASDRHDGSKSWRWYTMVGIAAVVISVGVTAYRRFSHT